MSARPRPDPQRFCGSVPWPLIGELADGAEVTACYVVQEKRRAETRAGKPYLKLTLGDRSGQIDAYVWDDVERWDPLCEVERVIGVRGRVSLYQDRLQLRVELIEPVEPGAADWEWLLPVTPLDREALERELDVLIASVHDAPLRALLRRCLGRGTELGQAFRVHPAAKRMHHAYVGGLLEHTVSVASACARLADHYRTQGFDVDRDLLLTGALLHDIGKLRELGAPPATVYTTEGHLLGHIVLGIQMVQREAEQLRELSADRLLLVQHLIASHQGKPEWDSPKVPQTVEAMILHYADDLDAKLNPVRALLTGVAPGEWTAYDRAMQRSFLASARTAGADPRAADAGAAPVNLTIDLFRS